MLTCKEELPNPHRNCVRELLNALICHDNDQRRIIIELRNLQSEFKRQMENIEFRCGELRQPLCQDTDKINEFTKHIATIDEVNECFTSKIETLKTNRQEILDAAKQCLLELSAEKCKLKNFHEKTVDYLKRYAVRTDDPKVVRNCEKDICEMQKLFVQEVAHIRKCETELQPFFKQLQDGDFKNFCNCCCFRDYEWIPQGKSLRVIDEIANDIKSCMGKTLRRAFAQLHVQQPPDPRSYLAAYLLNLERSEKILKEKLHMFGNI